MVGISEPFARGLRPFPLMSGGSKTQTGFKGVAKGLAASNPCSVRACEERDGEGEGGERERERERARERERERER
jgi:hypothetical protein